MKFYLELFVKKFTDYTLEILPFFILALLITSFLKVYVDLKIFQRILKDPRKAPLLTGILASALPVCSCSVIPLSYFIYQLSGRYAPVLSFLMIAPVISPVTIILTYGMLGFHFALFRLLFNLLFSLFIAYLSLYLFTHKKNPLEIEEGFQGGEKSFKNFWKEFYREGISIGKYVLFGIIIASLLVTFLSPENLKFLTGSPLSYPLIALISIPIYVCSGEEVPIAKALLELSFTPGQAMVFILAGSGICLPTVFAVLRFLPLKVMVYYLISWLIFSTLSGPFFDLLLKFLS
ncbi:MAG: permease [Caldimicrobium sp.]